MSRAKRERDENVAPDLKSAGTSVKMMNGFYGKPLSQVIASCGSKARPSGLSKQKVPTLHVNRKLDHVERPPRPVQFNLTKMGLKKGENDKEGDDDDEDDEESQMLKSRLVRRKGETQQQYLIRLCDEEQDGKGGDFAIRSEEGEGSGEAGEQAGHFDEE